MERQNLPPGEPGRDYDPVLVPDGVKLPWRTVGGVKVFHLTAEPVVHEVAPGLVVRTWGYNGRTPGPLIEAMEGDRVRIYVTNRLPAPTTVHWHGMLLPSGMDGVPAVTQPPIPPGGTFVYEYTLPKAGTFMYHSHFDTMTQESAGVAGMFVIHPRNPASRPDRDYALLLNEWVVEAGTSRPDTIQDAGFNVLTINGKAAPGTTPLVAQLGDRVRVRIGNLSAMEHHPIHLHGYDFTITETDGGVIPVSARWPETTVLVAVGQTRTIELLADNPGDWIFHCHMTHHMMNQMGHDIPNMLEADVSGVEEKIRRLIPGYMTMGTKGMLPMQDMDMPTPENAISMLGIDGQFGSSDMGGMLTMLRVRERWPSSDDPGPYDFPAGTVAWPAGREELERDGVQVEPAAPSPAAPAHQGHAAGH
jgi:hypothetical protein